MTDLEALKSMLEKIKDKLAPARLRDTDEWIPMVQEIRGGDVGAREVGVQDLHLAVPEGGTVVNVEAGYGGFFTQFVFDADGNLVDMGAYE